MEVCQVFSTSIFELRQESHKLLQEIRSVNEAAMSAMRHKSLHNLNVLQEYMLASMTTLMTTFAQTN